MTHSVDLVVFRLFTVCKISNLLRVETVLPTSESRYPSFTWLLGNHSDELTPWIPVMAALTSAASKFFVLPCCPFTFTGKFVKKNAKVSQYRDYLDYVRGVGSACGFEMEEDRLRIPSTKRICFVGRSRIKHGADQETQMQTILDMIPAEENSDENSEKRQKMDNKFVPRPAEIKVRNCTRIEQSVKEEILDIVLKRLLERRNHLNEDMGPFQVHIKEVQLGWNCGDTVPLSELASLVSKELLARLKSECGGIQTLLRNHNFMFVVIGGLVRLRCHATDSSEKGRKRKGSSSSSQSGARAKTKLCWFHGSHPDGCSVSAESCSWAHGDCDLAN